MVVFSCYSCGYAELVRVSFVYGRNEEQKYNSVCPTPTHTRNWSLQSEWRGFFFSTFDTEFAYSWLDSTLFRRGIVFDRFYSSHFAVFFFYILHLICGRKRRAQNISVFQHPVPFTIHQLSLIPPHCKKSSKCYLYS